MSATRSTLGLLAALFLFALAGAASAKEICLAQNPCEISGRSYHVKLPDDWDGVTPMPVLMHFHGWKRQGTLIVKHARISGATRKRGVLLLAPNGEGRTWNFYSKDSPDIAFAREVLEDAAKHFPIDRSRIYVSGYSFGAAMAWRFVCEDGGDVAALLAISGTLRQSEDCKTAPRSVRQVYGLKDTVLRYPFGPGGDETYPVALWRERLGCGEGEMTGEWRVSQRDLFRRWLWTGCASGGELTLDIHGRGHFIPVGWIGRQLDELLAGPS